MVNTKKNKSNRNRNKSKNKSKSKKRILNNKKRKVKTIKKRQRKKQTGSGMFAFLERSGSKSKVSTQDINELEKIYTGINLSNNWYPKNKKDCHNNLIALANLNNKSSMQDYLEIKERIHKCLPKEDVSRVLPYILAAVGENEPEKSVKEKIEGMVTGKKGITVEESSSGNGYVFVKKGKNNENNEKRFGYIFGKVTEQIITDTQEYNLNTDDIVQVLFNDKDEFKAEIYKINNTDKKNALKLDKEVQNSKDVYDKLKTKNNNSLVKITLSGDDLKNKINIISPLLSEVIPIKRVSFSKKSKTEINYN